MLGRGAVKIITSLRGKGKLQRYTYGGICQKSAQLFRFVNSSCFDNISIGERLRTPDQDYREKLDGYLFFFAL